MSKISTNENNRKHSTINVYEISKEKVDIELKEKVLSGEIRDRKTFIEKAKEKTPVKNIADEK